MSCCCFRQVCTTLLLQVVSQFSLCSKLGSIHCSLISHLVAGVCKTIKFSRAVAAAEDLLRIQSMLLHALPAMSETEWSTIAWGQVLCNTLHASLPNLAQIIIASS